MLLEVDMGNTYIKWRLVDAGVVCAVGRNLTAEDYFDWFAPLNAEHDLREVLVSCVAQSVRLQALQQVVRSVNSGLSLRVAQVVAEWSGVRFAYRDVTKLGVDRALAMVAAYRRCPQGVMVIDAGSAITADLVDGGGQHLGGYIMPGLPLLAKALATGTAQLPLVQEAEVSLDPGDSTASCIASGVMLMAVAVLDSLCAVARARGINNILVAGGDGAVLARYCRGRVTGCPDLVFEGLECVFGYPPVQEMTIKRRE